jgi:hypothetical protein
MYVPVQNVYFLLKMTLLKNLVSEMIGHLLRY